MGGKFFWSRGPGIVIRPSFHSFPSIRSFKGNAKRGDLMVGGISRFPVRHPISRSIFWPRVEIQDCFFFLRSPRTSTPSNGVFDRFRFFPIFDPHPKTSGLSFAFFSSKKQIASTRSAHSLSFRLSNGAPTYSSFTIHWSEPPQRRT